MSDAQPTKPADAANLALEDSSGKRDQAIFVLLQWAFSLNMCPPGSRVLSHTHNPELAVLLRLNNNSLSGYNTRSRSSICGHLLFPRLSCTNSTVTSRTVLASLQDLESVTQHQDVLTLCCATLHFQITTLGTHKPVKRKNLGLVFLPQ